MMHGRGESDSAIVAGKPTNKAERSAAEPVEPRAEAEGNASQQSMGRAQSRGTVSQALARIRQAARQRTKEKFTELLHHISIDQLDEAFFELKEDAAAGVDGLSWADYDRIKRKSRRDRMRVKLQAIKQELRRRMQQPIPQQGRWLQQVVTGYFKNHAV